MYGSSVPAQWVSCCNGLAGPKSLGENCTLGEVTAVKAICGLIMLLIFMAITPLCTQLMLAKQIPAEMVVPTLETALQELALLAHEESLSYKHTPTSVESHIRVVVEATSSVSALDVEAVGASVIASASASKLIEVDIAASRVVDLAKLPGVDYVRRPYAPVPLMVSEGVELCGAKDWHQAGRLGQGVRVAVIDLAFSGLSRAIARGELNNVVFTKDYTSQGLETGGSHGTACAEIVHDTAPEAELMLMKIASEVQLSNAVDDAISHGAHVISHSLGWFNTNFYDGTGIVVNICSHAVESGLAWVSAAGNCADGGHWEGDWTDTDGDRWLDFSGFDEVNNLYLNLGETVNFYLTWDAWPLSDEDYDLYLVDAFGRTVARSENWQTGTQEPTEFMSYTARVAGHYGIKIKAARVSTNPSLEIFCIPCSTSLEYFVAESSIAAPANSASVMAVGAIDWCKWENGPQQAYSSQGPTNNSLYSSSIVKPDICGPDGVSTSSFSDFYGTSASAPHVAGAMALVWASHPNWSAGDVRYWLQSNAIDMGPAGKDNMYGWGRLNLPMDNNIYGESCSSLQAGWNLISLSVEPDSTDPEDVFVYDPLYLAQYNTAQGQFNWVDKPPSATSGTVGTLTEVHALGGYWLATQQAGQYCVTGTALTGHQTINLPSASEGNGWYMIGVPYDAAWGDAIGSAVKLTRGGQEKWLPDAVEAGWLYGTILQWDAVAGEWIRTTTTEGVTLEPCIGYWLRTRVNDDVHRATVGSW